VKVNEEAFMADLREVFPILQDSATGEGEAPISRIEGEAAAGQEGLIGFSFKDSSGNVILPALTPQGKIPVDTEAAAANCLDANGELAAGSVGTIVDVTGAVITLTASKTYRKIGILASCLRASLFQLVQVDDITETVISEVVVGPGQFTVCCELGCLQFTAGATGTQELKVKAKNFNHASSLRATVTAEELV